MTDQPARPAAPWGVAGPVLLVRVPAELVASATPDQLAALADLLTELAPRLLRHLAAGAVGRVVHDPDSSVG
jgi:hypothetical protein